tara:strand:+ start:1252 stop:1482 length:231 start_codon:yes stop_codon:yes gene_type:complete
MLAGWVSRLTLFLLWKNKFIKCNLTQSYSLMAKVKEKIEHIGVKKKTSIGRGKHSKAMMNKSKRRSYKKYNRQGKQ